MSKCPCVYLKDLKKRIDAGEDPDKVLPLHFHPADPEETIEFIHYFLQVCRDPRNIAWLSKIREETYHAAG